MTTVALVSNILSGDGMIIFLVLILLFGAKRLPELARSLGSSIREFSKAKDGATDHDHPNNLPPA